MEETEEVKDAEETCPEPSEVTEETNEIEKRRLYMYTPREIFIIVGV